MTTDPLQTDDSAERETQYVLSNPSLIRQLSAARNHPGEGYRPTPEQMAEILNETGAK